MTFPDYIILAVVVVLFILALVAYKGKPHGCCGGKGGCSGNCSGCTMKCGGEKK